MRHSKNGELWLAFFACGLITGLYGWVVYRNHSFPAATSLTGYGLGISGFVLMLMTEVLYSLRKRSRRARWGSMESWLKFHIFTGLVGPYLVLLHTSWKFHGVAGAATLLTLLIVVSGFVGRYIFTRVPRSLDGMESTDPAQAAALARTRRWMSAWYAIHIPLGMALFVAAFFHIGAALYYSTFLK